MWANAACTERPVVGQSYTQLYVKLGRAFGFGEAKTWGDAGNDGSWLDVGTPTEEVQDPYFVALYVDFNSSDFNEPFTEGQIVPVSNNNGTLVTASYVFDFFDE